LETPEVFYPLALLNLGGFLHLWRGGVPGLARAAGRAALATVPLLVAGVPESAFLALSPALARVNPQGAGLLLLLVGAAFHSRLPGVGIVTAIITGVAVAGVSPIGAPHVAIQLMAVLLALHSLRWVDDGSVTGPTLRWGLAALWFADACVWVRSPGWSAETIVAVGALTVFVAAVARWWKWKLPVPLALWLGCAGVMLAGPLNWIITHGRPGILALGASLLLFAAGFLIAWTRQHWDRTTHPAPVSE
jgi:hypothetical protein